MPQRADGDGEGKLARNVLRCKCATLKYVQTISEILNECVKLVPSPESLRHRYANSRPSQASVRKPPLHTTKILILQ